MMYCSKNIQCNKKLQYYNISLHLWFNFINIKLEQTLISSSNLLTRVNVVLNIFKETSENRVSLARKLY